MLKMLQYCTARRNWGAAKYRLVPPALATMDELHPCQNTYWARIGLVLTDQSDL